MEENSAMIGVKREEEIELDLGLSIGGGFKNLNRTKNEPDGKKTSGFDIDLQIEFESKREIEALRRLEAKRKRQEKQQNKRTCNNGGGYGVGLDNRVWLKSPELEHELDVKEQDCKKNKVEEEEEEESAGPNNNNNMGMKNVNLNFTVQQNGVNMNNNNNNNNNQNVAGFDSTVCPVMYPYPPVQYVQFANGFRYPCLNVVPCWAAAGGVVGNEQNMVQTVVGRSFRPFRPGQDPGLNICNGYASDQNYRKAESDGSPVCSSSVVSGYRSSSHEGGGSSDTRSHSSHSLTEQRKLHDLIANEAKGQSEHSASSHLRETAQVYDETTNCSAYCGKPMTSPNNAQRSPSSAGQKIPSNAVDCSQTKPKEEAATELPTENLSPAVAKESKDMGKPPKPQTQNQNQNTPPLPHMPCVSTTGNGPNGKTIHGFLYRYTKTEVSIICVCHGTSFSPAEFVQHAGGTDVSHPLKHITVIPSAF